MILQQTIKAIAAGKAHSRNELATQLDISEDMLVQLIRELEQRGHLKLPAEDASCAGKCKGCAFAQACSTEQPGKVWQLTEKGQRLARGADRSE